jgi:hypothetical protein
MEIFRLTIVFLTNVYMVGGSPRVKSLQSELKRKRLLVTLVVISLPAHATAEQDRGMDGTNAMNLGIKGDTRLITLRPMV